MFSRFRRWSWLVSVAGALALVIAMPSADGQSRAGSIVFTTRRPPRDLSGNIRGWASANHATSYNEDTTSHTWRINFMAFLPRAPNTAEITLAWFHVEANRSGTYVSNEPIALADPGERNIFHSTSLHRGPGEFEAMERYEAVLSVSDSHGSHEVARGRIQLVGQLERHSGVVDFTGATPTAN